MNLYTSKWEDVLALQVDTEREGELYEWLGDDYDLTITPSWLGSVGEVVIVCPPVAGGPCIAPERELTAYDEDYVCVVPDSGVTFVLPAVAFHKVYKMVLEGDADE